MRRTKAELAAENAVLIHELELIRNRLTDLLQEDEGEEEDADEETDGAEDED